MCNKSNIEALEKEYASLESLWWLAMNEVEDQEGDGGTLDGWLFAVEVEGIIWREMELLLEKIESERRLAGVDSSPLSDAPF